MEGHNSSNAFEVFNVTGRNFFVLHPNCSQKIDDIVYDFSVRAVNIKDGYHLYGRYSQPTKNKLCSSGKLRQLFIVLFCLLRKNIDLILRNSINAQRIYYNFDRMYNFN